MNEELETTFYRIANPMGFLANLLLIFLCNLRIQ